MYRLNSYFLITTKKPIYKIKYFLMKMWRPKPMCDEGNVQGVNKCH